MNQTEMYAKMYATVLCAAADAIDDLERGHTEQAIKRLQNAIDDAEDFYLEHRDGTAPMTPVEIAARLVLGEPLTRE